MLLLSFCLLVSQAQQAQAWISPPNARGGCCLTCRVSRLAAAAGSGSDRWCNHELRNVVTTEWLQEHMFDAELAIVDIRGAVKKGQEPGSDFVSTVYEGLHEDYLELHIPNAVFADWTKDIAGRDANGVPAQLSDREAFAEAMEARGIGRGRRVVAYDNGNMLFATRLWWALRRYGFPEADISVLDGGWAKWVAEDRPVTDEVACPLKLLGEWGIEPEAEQPWLRLTAEQLQARLLERPQLHLIDARAAEQYTGEVRRAQRGGHIPGALNTPYKAFLQGGQGPYKTLKPLAGLREVLQSAGVDTSQPAAAYCNGGVASTVAMFALYQLGNARVTNYDGSWNEWGNREDLPAETTSLEQHQATNAK
ncbi:thiosulfate sulfurtransferase [Tribonema minus]|uniref:Sulfurtransferase n=1 Tax=Tribonema minus TaxID=303371 RepID=A0A835Z9V6_9STRA|nr:thiosulfate sulfurtransferase [Tribonema minus]